MPYVHVECTHTPLIRHDLVTQSQDIEQTGV